MSVPLGRGWEVVYANDVDANDERFWEWWSVQLNGDEIFRAFSEAEADRLVRLLISSRYVPEGRM